MCGEGFETEFEARLAGENCEPWSHRATTSRLASHSPRDEAAADLSPNCRDRCENKELCRSLDCRPLNRPLSPLANSWCAAANLRLGERCDTARVAQSKSLVGDRSCHASDSPL